MTHKVRIVVVIDVLVSVIMLDGWTCVTSADDLRRIVSFRPITLTDPLCLPLKLLPNGYCLDLTTTLGYQTALTEVEAVPGVEVVGSPTVHKLWISNALLIQLPANNIIGALSSLLQSLHVVDVTKDILAWVDPIIPFTGTLGPEHYNWGLERIYIPEVRLWWPALKGSGVTVAILDTGIALHHPDLNIGTGTNAIEEELDAPPDDDHGHGTHMAGIIGAKVNGVGTKGAAPEATVVPGRCSIPPALAVSPNSSEACNGSMTPTSGWPI
jgi:subtilisin family serine protease